MSWSDYPPRMPSWAPSCGMEYDDTAMVIDGRALFGHVMRHRHSPHEADYSMSRLFQGLFLAREVFIGIGGDWRNADLVRFALEKTPYMPWWVEEVPSHITMKVLNKLIAARRRLIRITRLIQWSDCFGNHAATIRWIDRYIGQKPAIMPDRLGWTPRRCFWCPKRASCPHGILNAPPTCTDATCSQSFINASGEIEVAHPSQYEYSHLHHLYSRRKDYWFMGELDSEHHWWYRALPYSVYDMSEFFKIELRFALPVVLHRSDHGPVDVKVRSSGAEPLVHRPRRGDIAGRGSRLRRGTWAVENVYNSQRQPREVTACKMAIKGAWCPVWGCE